MQNRRAGRIFYKSIFILQIVFWIAAYFWDYPGEWYYVNAPILGTLVCFIGIFIYVAIVVDANKHKYKDDFTTSNNRKGNR